VLTTVGIAPNLQLPPNTGEWRGIINLDSKNPMVISFSHPTSTFAADEQIDKAIDSGGEKKNILESIFGWEETYQSFNESKRNVNYRGREPYDLIAGDISFHQEYWGNSLLIGLGGLNMLRVSHKNFFMQSLIDNLARLMAGNLEIITDLGVLSFKNDDDRVCMRLQASREFNKKVQAGIYDIDLQVGSCSDGNTVSFKYKIEGTEDVYVFTVDTKGAAFLHTPDDVCHIYGKNLVTSVTKNHGHSVQENYEIDVEKDYILTTKDNGSIRLGKEGLSDTQNEIVRRPHVEDKYIPLLNKIAAALFSPPVLDINFLPFMIRSPEFAQLYTTCVSQSLVALQDTTKKTLAE